MRNGIHYYYIRFFGLRFEIGKYGINAYMYIVCVFNDLQFSKSMMHDYWKQYSFDKIYVLTIHILLYQNIFAVLSLLL